MQRGGQKSGNKFTNRTENKFISKNTAKSKK